MQYSIERRIGHHLRFVRFFHVPCFLLLAVRDLPHLPPLPEFKLTPGQRAQARDLVAGGMSLRRVARHFGVSRMAIWRAVHADGDAVVNADTIGAPNDETGDRKGGESG